MTYQPESPYVQQPDQAYALPPPAAPAAPAAPYQQVAYQPQPEVQPYQAEAPAPRTALPTTLAHTNTFALLAIILAFLSPIAGIVFGHLALGQIKRNGDTGRGIALTGLILGYAYFVLIALILIAYIGMIIVMFASFGAAMSSFDSFDSF